MKIFDLEVSKDTIDIRNSLHFLKDTLHENGIVRWNHNGQIHVIPRSLLENLMGVYDDACMLVQNGLWTELPESTYTLHWYEVAEIETPLPKDIQQAVDALTEQGSPTG